MIFFCRQMLVFCYGNIVGGAGGDGMACDLGLPGIAGGHPGIDNFPVLVVRKADGAVTAPIPAFIGGNHLYMALFVGDLQLGQEFCLCAVLIFQSPGPAGATIPAVGQLDRQSIFACFQQARHVVGLILDPLAVVRNAGGANEIAHTLPVDVCLIQSAGSDIQPSLFHINGMKAFAETVHRIALLFVYPIIPGDPSGFPTVNAGLKGRLRPVPGSAVFVPEPDLPEDLRFGGDCWAAPGDLHGIRFHFSAVP